MCLDNSILTCLYQRGLDLGADISMTSGAVWGGCGGSCGGGCGVVECCSSRDRRMHQGLYLHLPQGGPSITCQSHSHLRCSNH